MFKTLTELAIALNNDTATSYKAQCLKNVVSLKAEEQIKSAAVLRLYKLLEE